MKQAIRWCAMSLILAWPLAASAEILAMLNYESKTANPLRKEGIAIVDVDPASPAFGKVLADIPLPGDLVAHHIYYNRDKTKAYVTALGKSVLHVLDLKRFPFRLTAVPVPQCSVLEDVVLSPDNKTWFLTCMGSHNVVVGDAVTDRPLRTIAAAHPADPHIRWPHGIALNTAIDRLLVTSTISPDLKQPGDSVTVIEASSGRVLSTHRLAIKPGAKSAPVEITFHPKQPVVYVTNMVEAAVFMGVWDAARKAFAFRAVDDLAKRGQGFALEMEFNAAGDRMYVSVAQPGVVNVYDVANPVEPKFLRTIAAAPGAHHLVFSPDEKYLFVQNSLLNLPGMDDGSITVIDVAQGKPIHAVNTLKDAGYNPNSIVILPAK
ncbi:MAG: YncE family protein [Candidatus Rokubacteria bacterium]|nr:YncE family protein [Candidatus Rokubacteria bacterium]